MDFVKRFQGEKSTLLILLVIILQTGLCYRAIKPFYRNNQEIKEITEKLKNYPDQTIYTFNIDMTFPAYGVKNRIINIWENKIKKVEPHALVLINRQNIALQWKEMNPMLNWKKIEKEGKIVKLETMQGGWELYETTP